MDEYGVMESGEGFLIEPGVELKARCCDCGLVHDIVFEFTGSNSVIARVSRNNRATSAGRRHMVRVAFGGKNSGKEKQ